MYYRCWKSTLFTFSCDREKKHYSYISAEAAKKLRMGDGCNSEGMKAQRRGKDKDKETPKPEATVCSTVSFCMCMWMCLCFGMIVFRWCVHVGGCSCDSMCIGVWKNEYYMLLMFILFCFTFQKTIIFCSYVVLCITQYITEPEYDHKVESFS